MKSAHKKTYDRQGFSRYAQDNLTEGSRLDGKGKIEKRGRCGSLSNFWLPGQDSVTTVETSSLYLLHLPSDSWRVTSIYLIWIGFRNVAKSPDETLFFSSRQTLDLGLAPACLTERFVFFRIDDGKGRIKGLWWCMLVLCNALRNAVSNQQLLRDKSETGLESKEYKNHADMRKLSGLRHAQGHFLRVKWFWPGALSPSITTGTWACRNASERGTHSWWRALSASKMAPLRWYISNSLHCAHKRDEKRS